MADFSFDIVSEVDWMEVQNAVQQAAKEIQTRFDFKGSSSEVKLEGKDKIVLVGDDELKLKNVRDVLDQKLARRGVSLKAVEAGTVEPAAKGTLRQTLTLTSGLGSDLAKDISKFIRGLPVRVQSTIQGDQVRVSSKKKDDLQSVMAAVKAQEWPRAMQFTNYR
ncbi:MAG: YajQ family cyclic di-GMP-binding protein [Candidatus Eiseniibacteriota bacterium]